MVDDKKLRVGELTSAWIATSIIIDASNLSFIQRIMIVLRVLLFGKARVENWFKGSKEVRVTG